MSKLSERKFQIYLAIGTTIAPFLISTIIDKNKNIPLSSTFISWVNWVWITLFEYQFKVWQILIGITVIILLLFLLVAIKSKSSQTLPASSWLNYIKDEFGGTNFQWIWQKNYYEKYEISDLRPICKCGTSLPMPEDFFKGNIITCPRCDNRIFLSKDSSSIKILIHDNIDRDIYLDRI